MDNQENPNQNLTPFIPGNEQEQGATQQFQPVPPVAGNGMYPQTPQPSPQPAQPPQQPLAPGEAATAPSPTLPVSPPATYQSIPQQPQVELQQSSQPQPTFTQAPHQAAGKDPGHGLGIASLVLSLIGITPVGIILGLIALNKSKKAGFGTNVMALIGIILGVVGTLSALILAGLVVNNFQGAQAKARDVQAVSRVNSVHSKLEEYYNENARYPKEINTDILKGIDAMSLTDPSGGSIVVYSDDIKDISSASLVTKPSINERFQYIAFNCDTTGCSGYLLRTYIERPTTIIPNPYIKLGLQNP